MKNFIILVFLFFFLIKYQALAQSTFQKAYFGKSSVTEAVKGVTATQDGGFVLTGKTSLFALQGPLDPFLLKIDSLGEQKWFKILGLPGGSGLKHLIQTSDNGLLLTGSHSGSNGVTAIIIKTDSTGNVLWANELINYQTSHAWDVIEASDGSYLITGEARVSGMSYDVLVVKLDNSGNLVWEKRYGSSRDEFAYSITESADSNFIIVGSTHIFAPNNFDIYILKITSNGQLIWSKKLGTTKNEYGRWVTISTNGDLIVGANWVNADPDASIIRITNDGKLKWIKLYNGIGQDYVWELHEIDNNFIVAGYQVTPSNGIEASLFATDTSGTLIWAKLYGGVKNDLGRTLAFGKNGFLLAGETNSYANGNNLNKKYIIKTDIYGNSGCSETTVTLTTISLDSISLDSFAISVDSLGVLASLMPITILDTILAEDTICLCNLNFPGFNFSAVQDTVSFTDLSTSTISWTWDFGDSTNSSNQNPVHIYDSVGNYRVCLTVNDNNCQKTICDSICMKPISKFTYSVNGAQVNFVDSSEGATNLSWDFDDSTSASTPNPVHLFTQSGVYNVCLIASNSCGSDTTCDSIQIVITSAEQKRFTETAIIYPNPFHNTATLIIYSPEIQLGKNLELIVFDPLGRNVKLVKLNNGKNFRAGIQFTIDRENLNNGIYFYMLVSENNILHKDKILIN